MLTDKVPGDQGDGLDALVEDVLVYSTNVTTIYLLFGDATHLKRHVRCLFALPRATPFLLLIHRLDQLSFPST